MPTFLCLQPHVQLFHDSIKEIVISSPTSQNLPFVEESRARLRMRLHKPQPKYGFATSRWQKCFRQCPACRDVKFDKGGEELRKAKNVYCTEYNIVAGDDNVNVGMIPLDFEKDSKFSCPWT